MGRYTNMSTYRIKHAEVRHFQLVMRIKWRVRSVYISTSSSPRMTQLSQAGQDTPGPAGLLSPVTGAGISSLALHDDQGSGRKHCLILRSTPNQAWRSRLLNIFSPALECRLAKPNISAPAEQTTSPTDPPNIL